ncbi:MAG TPA: exosortase E/protease, VPEID-CTERM system [Candidatus Limnocylindrales bacterium]|nr:exosortase E/protease, VPEID-CTERM system [Candidatus Limnocylindrales bacterium]
MNTAAVTVPAAPSLRLSLRLGALALLILAEVLAVSLWLDNASLSGSGGVAGLIFHWGALAVRAGVAAMLALLVFGRSAAPAEPLRLPQSPIRWPVLALHAAAFAGFLLLSLRLYGPHSATVNGLAALWILAGAIAVAIAAVALVPLSAWLALLRRAGDALTFAAIAACAGAVAGQYARQLWAPLSGVTFSIVTAVLRLFVNPVVCHPATFTVGSARFSVQIAPECSGIEGMALMLAFSAAWLWFFRREWRFPNALLLVPVGLLAMFVLNSARIAALILIGNAGAERIALGGFHSQAGWLAFTGVALGMCVLARRIPWLVTSPPSTVAAPVEAPDSTAAFLAPFLAILAAAIVSRAATADFEWAYGLRVLAGAAALWCFRGVYRKMDWRIGWPAAAVGAIVFAIWIVLDRGSRTAPGAPAALVNAPHALSAAWVALRILGATVTVPLAEELAFRGFLLRRLASPAFESVSWRHFAWMPFVASSAAFGLLHGERWAAGTLAGMLYALVMLRRGRIGEAAAAHSVTNGLLAIWVLTTGKWYLW